MLSARSVQEIHSPRVFFFYWESCAVVQTNVFNYCFQHCNLSFCVRNSFILCCCFAGSWPGTVCESFNQKINNSSVPTYRNVIYAEENVKKSSRRRLSPVKHPLVLAALTESQYMVATPTTQPPSEQLKPLSFSRTTEQTKEASQDLVLKRVLSTSHMDVEHRALPLTALSEPQPSIPENRKS